MLNTPARSGSARWAALLSLTLLVATSAPLLAADKWIPGDRMSQAVGRIIGSARRIGDIHQFGYEDGVCILAGFLQAGGSADFIKTLQGGQEYVILGGGDNFMKDMDIEITDSNGRKIAEDTQTDASPLVRFRAPSNGKVTLKAIAAKADRGAFTCVVILRRGGWDIPTKNLATAVARLLVQGDDLHNKMPGKVFFHDVKNQWAMFGSVRRQGESTTIENFNLGTGKRVVLAAGDDFIRDVDLFVKDRNENLLGKDEDPDAHPRVVLNAKNGSGSLLTYKNIKSTGAGLIVMTVLQILDGNNDNNTRDLEVRDLRGTWRAVRLVKTGSNDSFDAANDIGNLVIGDRSMQFNAQKNGARYDVQFDQGRGLVKIDFYKSGETVPYGTGIARLEGNKLRLVYDWTASRPGSFDSPPAGAWDLVLVRN